MSVIEELIRKEDNGSLSFGNYKLNEKTKVEDFAYEGDIYKVKTFNEITKLERNGSFVYESVPGTNVEDFKIIGQELTFAVQGFEDTQVTLELEPNNKYKVFINDINVGTIKTNLGGKIVLNVEFHDEKPSYIRILEL